MKATRGAAGALWRGVRRIAANDVILVSLLLALLVIVFFHDIVFLGRTLVTSPWQPGTMGFAPPFGYPEAQADPNVYLVDPLASAAASEPATEKMAGLMRDFQVPLWNANISLGRPFLAEDASANPSLIRLPLMVSSSPEMWDAFLLARFFVAGLFTYLLAKRLGLAKLAAFGSAVAFTFSGYFMLRVSMEHTDSAMMVPVLLYAFELLLDRPGPGRTIFAVAAVAFGVFAANPQPAVVLLLYGSGYYLARALVRARTEDGFRVWARILPLASALAVGVGLTAFKLVPFLELSGFLGSNELGLHRHTGAGLRVAHLQALISLFVPYFDGPPTDNFQGTGIRNYVGVAMPMLAFIGLWNRPAMTKFGWFFLATAVLLLAKMYGVPVVNWLGRLPVLKVIDFGQYAPPTINFSLAMLAGLGIDQVSRARWRWWHLLLVVAALALLVGWLVWLNRDKLDSIPTNHLVIQLGFAGGLIVAAAAMIAAIRRRLLPLNAGTALLIGLITVELFAFTTPVKGELASWAHPDIPVIERPRRYDPYTEPPYISFLREDTSKYRVIGLQNILFPNTAEAYDLDDIRGITGISLRRYMNYIKSFIDPSLGDHRFAGLRWPPLDMMGGPDLLTDNPMFDLLNVKYVITPPADWLLTHDYHLAELFLPSGTASNPSVRLDAFTVGGEEDVVLYQHPTSSLSYDFTPSEESRFLLFRLALDPQVWAPEKGDGVLFEVSAREDEGNETLFSRFVDPKNNPEDRRWIDGVVDLEAFLGQPVTLVLSTSPGATSTWDWAGWGGLRLAPSPETPPNGSASSQFELVYDGEVKIYENRNAFPRAFVVHQAVLAPGQDAAIALMQRPDFDPSAQAVVEGSLAEDQLTALAGSPAVDGSSVEITHYSDDRVELLARMDNPGLLVLSDTYYPGWKAYVDGNQVPIYPTDVALRSVFLPAGEHSLEFTYSPTSFKLGSTVTIASLAVLLTYVAWGPTRTTAARWLRRRGEGR